MAVPSMNRLFGYARVRALRVQGCAEHNQCNHDRRQNFQRFRFHRFVLGNISQPGTQTDARRGQFKKDLNNCAVIRPAFSSLLSRYSFSKTRNLSSSIRRSKRAVNGAHDLCGRHRAAVFRRELSCRAGEEFSRASRFELHQLEEVLVVLSFRQLRFRIVEPRQIFLRQINAALPENPSRRRE